MVYRIYVEKKAGLAPGTLNTNTVYNPYTKESKIDDFSQEIFRANISSNDIYDALVETYQQAVCKAAHALRTGDYNDKDSTGLKNLIMDIYSKNTNLHEYNAIKSIGKDFDSAFTKVLSHMLTSGDYSNLSDLSNSVSNFRKLLETVNPNGMTFKQQSLEDARYVFMRMACFAAEKKQPRLQALVTKALDDAFDEAMVKYNKTLQ